MVCVEERRKGGSVYSGMGGLLLSKALSDGLTLIRLEKEERDHHSLLPYNHHPKVDRLPFGGALSLSAAIAGSSTNRYIGKRN